MSEVHRAAVSMLMPGGVAEGVEGGSKGCAKGLASG